MAVEGDRLEYNHRRPHSALRDQTSASYAAGRGEHRAHRGQAPLRSLRSARPPAEVHAGQPGNVPALITTGTCPGSRSVSLVLLREKLCLPGLRLLKLAPGVIELNHSLDCNLRGWTIIAALCSRFFIPLQHKLLGFLESP